MSLIFGSSESDERAEPRLRPRGFINAHDARTPPWLPWLLAGSMAAAFLVALKAIDVALVVWSQVSW